MRIECRISRCSCRISIAIALIRTRRSYCIRRHGRIRRRERLARARHTTATIGNRAATGEFRFRTHVPDWRKRKNLQYSRGILEHFQSRAFTQSNRPPALRAAGHMWMPLGEHHAADAGSCGWKVASVWVHQYGEPPSTPATRQGTIVGRFTFWGRNTRSTGGTEGGRVSFGLFVKHKDTEHKGHKEAGVS